MFFFFQAEDGIRDLVRSRGLGDVYKRQALLPRRSAPGLSSFSTACLSGGNPGGAGGTPPMFCLLYTSDAADERSSVDLGGRRIIKKKIHRMYSGRGTWMTNMSNRTTDRGQS